MISAVIYGNLGNDPELSYLNDKTPVLNFRVASSSYKKGGNETTWVGVAVFGQRAEKIAGFLVKGKPIIVTGQLKSEVYLKDGVERTSLKLKAEEVTFVSDGRGEQTKSDGTGAVVTGDNSPF